MSLAETYPALAGRILALNKMGVEDEEIQAAIRPRIQELARMGFSVEEINKALGEVPQPSIIEPIKETGKELARMGLGVGGAFGGAILGGVAAPLAGPAAPVMPFAGAAAGSGAGEALAQYLFDEEINPRQVALQAVLGAIPGLKAPWVTSLLGRVALRGGEGALVGGGASVASDVVEGEKPDWGKALKAALVGSLIGAGVGTFEGRQGRKKTEPPLTKEQQARLDAIAEELDHLERLRQSPRGRDLLRQQLLEEQARAAEGPPLPPELQARAEAIEQQLLEAERLRRSPQGAILLRQQLAEQEAAGIPAGEAALQLEQAKLASEIEAEAFLQAKAPKRGVGLLDFSKGKPKPEVEPGPSGGGGPFADIRAAEARAAGSEVATVANMADDLRARGDDIGARNVEAAYSKGGLKDAEDVFKARMSDAETKLPETEAATPKAKTEPAAPERATIVRTPEPKAPPSTEGTFRQWLTGIKISEDLTNIKDRGELVKLKESSLRRAVVKGAPPGSISLSRAVERAHEAGFIPEESLQAFLAAVDDTLSGKKVYSIYKQNLPEPSINKMVAVEAERHVQNLQDAVAGVEYKGKVYEAVIPEPGGGVRLKNKPDKVLKSPEKILEIEERVPFDIPEETPPPTPAPKGLRPVIRLKNGKQFVGKEGERHADVMERVPEKQQSAIRDTGWMSPEGKFLTPDEATIYKFREPAAVPESQLSPEEIAARDQMLADLGARPKPRFEKTEAGMQGVIEGTPQRKISTEPLRPKTEQAETLTPLESVPAKGTEQMTIGQLFKKGFGSEVGAVGNLPEGMRQIEADARAARRELYNRLYAYAREKGVSLKQAARDHNVLQRDLARLQAEARTEGWGPTEETRPFTPLEKFIGTRSDNPEIYDRVREEFKGTNLNDRTIKRLADAAYEGFTASGKTIDPDIPITIQVAEGITDGTIPLTRDLEPYRKEIGIALAGSESQFGRGLARMSQLKQKMKQAGMTFGDFGNEPPPSAWEYANDLMHRWINIWRGSLVGQLATHVRNAETQGVRLEIDGLENIVDGALRQMLHLGPGSERGLSDGFRRAMENFTDLVKAGKRQQANEILSLFPSQKERLFYQYASDVNTALKERPVPPGKIFGTLERITQAAEQSVEIVNTVNRGQEFLIRRAAFRAKLAELLEKAGQNIDAIDLRAIDEKMVAEAVDHALEVTFAATPQKGPFKALLDVYKAVPPLYFVAPFPRFMFNSWKFFYEFSPAGLLKLLSSKERAAIAAGNLKTINRAIIGTGLLGAAYMLRNSEYAGDKWYELKIGDKTIDTRPFNPFAAYLFVADVVKRMNDGTLDRLGFKEIAQGLLSANFRAGTGLFMLDKVADIIGGAVSSQGVPETSAKDVKRAIGETLGGFLTPLQTIRDVLSDERLLSFIGQEDFAKEEAKLRDVRDEPFWGPLKARIPGLSQTLPQRQFPIGPDAERQEPALRQVSGVIMYEKTPVQQEADRLGLEQRDLLQSTGIAELDRQTSEIMRPIAERTLSMLMASRPYLEANDLVRRIWIKKLIHQIGNEARRHVLAKNRDLRLEYMIRKAGKDEGRLLRETFQARGLILAD